LSKKEAKVEEKQYKMKEVLDILKKEYKGITASALRFWEEKGLVNPSDKTSGHHRRYNEEDLNIIRFVKDLSNFGYSLNQIVEEVLSVKNKIESERIDKIKPELYSTTYVAKIFMHYRSRVRLAMRFKLYLDMNKSAKHIPTFKRSTLEKRLEHNTPGDFIRKVDNLGLTKPKEMDGGFFYSSCDEVILETLIYILEEEKDFLERCQDFISAVQYLYKEIGLTARFAAGPVMSLDLSTYKALLYNLIQERFSYEENKEKERLRK
jgi:DNA-binding transcriptional MerR regulator